MARRRKTRDLTTRKPPRIMPRRADEIASGDILWSALSGRLFVLETFQIEVAASGNLLAQEEGPWEDDPDAPKTKAIVIIARKQSNGETVQLGAYAPRAMLDTVRSA